MNLGTSQTLLHGSTLLGMLSAVALGRSSAALDTQTCREPPVHFPKQEPFIRRKCGKHQPVSPVPPHLNRVLEIQGYAAMLGVNETEITSSCSRFRGIPVWDAVAGAGCDWGQAPLLF